MKLRETAQKLLRRLIRASFTKTFEIVLPQIRDALCGVSVILISVAESKKCFPPEAESKKMFYKTFFRFRHISENRLLGGVV